MTVEELVAEAMALPVERRLEVVDALMASLHEPDPDIDAAWAAECERRMAAIEAGEARWIPGEEVMARVRQRFAR